MKIVEIYRQDQENIKNWEKKYTDREFYNLNKKLRQKLDLILIKNKKITAKEKYFSAMIMHHGFNIKSVKKALDLANQSFNEGYKPAKTLIAQSTDRLLQLQRKPQKFGTQIIKLKNGKLKMYKIDKTVSDKERKEYGLPSLHELKNYLNN